jgi:DNA polymerase III subunit epsilon
MSRTALAHRTQPTSIPKQISLDDLGLPLDQVTFCVIDLETTGASPKTCAITEVAAARYQGGVCTGTFATLVNPGVPIPPEITYLTGITEDMVGPAPKIDVVLPALLEFVQDSVIVGHNVRFDLGFLNAACEQRSYPRFSNRVVDTLRLARRLLKEEVPNCKLGTLAACLHLPSIPDHRALNDVRATADLLHYLVERAAGLGVMGLDDLLELPTLGRHPSSAKLKLTDGLPRRPGVYLFRDAGGKVLYVGKATNLRQRVRSYFGFDERRKVGPLLKVTAKIDHFECATVIEAEVMEVRLIQHFLPRFNRQSKFWTNYAYLRIGGTAGKPLIAATKDPLSKAPSWLLGPFPSLSAARVAALALREAITGLAPNTRLDRDLIDRPDLLLATLDTQMRELAEDSQFEAAAAIRDRAGALSRAISRQHRIDAVRRHEHIELEWLGCHLTIEHGRLKVGNRARPTPPPSEPIPANMADELHLLTTFIDRQAHRIRLGEATTSSDGTGFAYPFVPTPGFRPRTGRTTLSVDRTTRQNEHAPQPGDSSGPRATRHRPTNRRPLRTGIAQPTPR